MNVVQMNIENFLVIGFMAAVFILMLKALMGLYPVEGLQEVVFAI